MLIYQTHALLTLKIPHLSMSISMYYNPHPLWIKHFKTETAWSKSQCHIIKINYLGIYNFLLCLVKFKFTLDILKYPLLVCVSLGIPNSLLKFIEKKLVSKILTYISIYLSWSKEIILDFWKSLVIPHICQHAFIIRKQ